MSDGVPRFGTTAPVLAENGYAPIPLYFGRKNPCVDEWSHFQYQDSDASRFAQAGTGILCGKVVGLDIDVRDPLIAAQLDARAELLFGPAPRRIGQAPKVLRMLHATEPFTKLRTRGYRFDGDGPEDAPHAVEILATGQQFVAFNIHPDTGKPYAWNGAGDPLKVPIGLISSISPAQARAFIAEADVLLAQHGTAVGRLVQDDDTREHVSSDSQRAADPALLRAALEALPNPDLDYDSWIRVMYSAKGALGDDGLDAFLNWSARSAKDDPETSERDYKAANPTRLGAGTIYYLAGQAGWRRPHVSHSGPDDAGYETGDDTAAVPKRTSPLATEWSDPVNILGEIAAPAFTGDELPPVLSEYALAYAAATGFDPSLTLSTAVVVAAAALSDSFQIVGDSNSGWFQQPRLWLLNIGPPGTGKTPAQKALLAPLWDMQKSLRDSWERECADLMQADGDKKAPSLPKIIVSDVTIEALSESLRHNPRGLLVATDEFESWLGSHDLYRSGGVSRDRGEWLRLFDGGPHQIERVTRGGQGGIFVANWGASILTATTPVALAKLTRSLPEDGLLQRFLPVIARRKREGERVAGLDEMRARYVQTIRQLYAAAPRAHNGCVSLSFEAQTFLQTWLRQNQITQEAFGSIEPAFESHLAKYPSFLLRLTLTFHAAEIVNQEHELARDPAAFPVPLATITTAAKFLKRATLHAVALYLDRSGSAVYQLARDTGRAILARGKDHVARRDLIQAVRAFRKAPEDLQDSALRLLVDMGWLRGAEGGYHKATPARYTINPALSTKFAALAERERAHRATIRELLADDAADRRRD